MYVLLRDIMELCHRSLSLQGSQKGFGTGNIKTGWTEIALPPDGGWTMNKLFYPAVFHKAEEGGFWVTFPDLPECMTQGDNMQQAYEMAVDALGLSLSTMEANSERIPKASSLDEVDPEGGTLVIVEFDMLEYRRRNSSKAVKKT